MALPISFPKSERLAIQLADDLHNLAEEHPNEKLWVGIVGFPGSGKSTLSHLLCRALRKKYGFAAAAVVLPMDGFHLRRAELSAMPNPEEAFKRRGAPWTFAPALMLDCLQKIQQNGQGTAPAFDHGIGDPQPDAIHIGLTARIVIVEGLYLYMDEAPWCQIRSLLRVRLFIRCDQTVAMERVYRRHMSASKRTPTEARFRIDTNDGPNCAYIAPTIAYATQVIDSQED
ncbi:putative ATP-dependent kinase YFH7 [Paratrimastix pyriformis]|uniref:ATP-dependent kinase YFH7 n=1 Tax=Paratrimastix pyriformis TaxID=342808 RepID=A0ABQ8U9J6_9EUKA|nr:putative ATP-dependent kinase YFH7 [Paratrimastix pyriformis]